MNPKQFRKYGCFFCAFVFSLLAVHGQALGADAGVASAPQLGGRIAAGFAHSVFVDNNGTAWFWGRDVTEESWFDAGRLPPRPVLKKVRSVSAGGKHVVFFRNDNTIWAWGSNSFEQFGDPPVPSMLSKPRRVLEDYFSIAKVISGSYSLLILTADKVLWRNGRNWNEPRTSPARHKVAEHVVQAAPPEGHTMFLACIDGRVRYMGFGDNSCAQLNGTAEPEKQLTPREFSIPGIDAESMAELHTRDLGSLAVLKNGEVRQWGMFCLNKDMYDEAQRSTAPSKVIGLPPVRTIAARDCYFLALTPEGDVWEADVYEDAPRLVMHDAAEIAVGLFHSVVLKKDGTVWCWGGNDFGQIDLSEEDYYKDPVQMRFPGQR